MADYKNKINEVKNEVMNAASNIATEENKQKLAEATSTAVKKAKGLNKKTIAIIAVVAVVLIAILSSLGGGIDKDVQKELENYVYQQTTYEAVDLKLEGEYEIPDSIFKEEVDYYISGRYDGSGERDGYYFLCIVSKTGDGIEENISCRMAGEYEKKSELKDTIKSFDFLK